VGRRAGPAVGGRATDPAQLATLRTETDVYRRILAAGGLVALGTDQPLVTVGLSLHLGWRALHRGGLSPAAVLRTVTVLPALLFGVADDLGTVEPGRLADLTVVDGDPFTDFDTLVRTVSVLRGGMPYTTEDLVAAYEPAARQAAGEDDWLEVGRLMRREGCCDSGV
jgi:imidazolonepropionase-like amidohydrolase